jgi:hypothetical protein
LGCQYIDFQKSRDIAEVFDIDLNRARGKEMGKNIANTKKQPVLFLSEAGYFIKICRFLIVVQTKFKPNTASAAQSNMSINGILKCNCRPRSAAASPKQIAKAND